MIGRGLDVLTWGKVVAGICDHSDELLCDMKSMEFLGQPTMCYILRRPLFHVVS
jgi:hypothetical protein